MPEDHTGHAREGRTGRVKTRRGEIDEPPHPGNAQLQVRIAFEQRAMRYRQRGARGDVVTAGAAARIGDRESKRRRVRIRNRQRRQRRHGRTRTRHHRRIILGIRDRKERFRAVRSRRRNHVGSRRHVVPAVRQREHRGERCDERISRRPRRRAIPEHAKLRRERARAYRRVDARGKSIELRTLTCGQGGELRARDAFDVKDARRDVTVDGEISQYIRKPPVDQTPVQIELKQPIRALQIAFGKEEIVLVLRANVRNAARIARYGHVAAHAQSRDDARRQLCARANAGKHVGGKTRKNQQRGRERQPREQRDAPEQDPSTRPFRANR